MRMRTRRECFHAATEFSAVYIVLASLHLSKRMASPSDNAVKHLEALLTRKGGAKGALGVDRLLTELG
eukprot:5448999-Pleurochrysis_carterae.AAC.1